MQWMIYVAFAVAILQPLSTHARPNGAPTSVCSSLVPVGHPVGAANDAPGGYFVDTSLRDTNFAFNASTEYTITLYGRATMFRGFVIQARDMADSSLIGAFSDLEAGTTQLLNCNDPGSDSTVTHTNNNDKIGVTVTWTSPPSTGVVEIRYSVVRQFRVAYYANLNAADFPPPCRPPPAVTATPETFYPIVFGFPVGCQRSTCDYFVATGPNPANGNYLDIHLEGNAQGWVAVGFSKDMRMNGTDVLGCRVVGGMVEAIDSWNPAPRPPLQGNMPDAMINDTCPLFTQFENGRIICRFSRLINTSDVDNDLDLDDSYFLIFGRRLEAQPPATPALANHMPSIPMSSEMMLNPTMDNFTNLSPTPTPPAIACPPQPDPNTVYAFTSGTPGSGYFFGARVNPVDSNYLDMRLEGNAEGWVAIGFSDTQNMDLSDVLGCKRDTNTGVVTVLDTWNPGPNRSPNILDENQDGLCQHEAQFMNGRITCTFSRLIVAQSGRDFSLNESLFQLYGMSMTGGPNTTALSIHMPNTPRVSTGRLVATLQEACPPQPDPNTVYAFTSGTPGSGYFFGARVNPVDSNYLDMRLEGNAEGWVAIGFSDTQSMEESDVLGCKRDATTGIVTVLDTWNPGPQRSRSSNMLDENQDGLCQHDAQFVNGRIMCTFSRLIVAQSNRDFSLNGSLFQLYGMSTTGGPSNAGLAFHVPNTPSTSTGRFVAALGGSASMFPQHGILMIIFWLVLVVAAI